MHSAKNQEPYPTGNPDIGSGRLWRQHRRAHGNSHQRPYCYVHAGHTGTGYGHHQAHRHSHANPDTNADGHRPAHVNTNCGDAHTGGHALARLPA